MAVTVEEVSDRRGLRRFLDLGAHLHDVHPGWAPPVLSIERARLDTALNPFFEEGDATYLLARRAGRPVGRMTVHIAGPGADACFGFFESLDQPDIPSALFAAAAAWVGARERRDWIRGPVSFLEEDGAGVRAGGHEEPPAAGIPWHPPYYASLLEAVGCEVVEDRRWWRLDARQIEREGLVLEPADLPVPVGLGPYRDDRLVLAGPGGEPTVVAVPDVVGGLGALGVRSAWRAARQARRREWETCVIVRMTGDPVDVVPVLAAAAARAGYRWVLSPWAPDDRPATIVQRLYRRPLS